MAENHNLGNATGHIQIKVDKMVQELNKAKRALRGYSDDIAGSSEEHVKLARAADKAAVSVGKTINELHRGDLRDKSLKNNRDKLIQEVKYLNEKEKRLKAEGKGLGEFDTLARERKILQLHGIKLQRLSNEVKQEERLMQIQRQQVELQERREAFEARNNPVDTTSDTDTHIPRNIADRDSDRMSRIGDNFHNSYEDAMRNLRNDPISQQELQNLERRAERFKSQISDIEKESIRLIRNSNLSEEEKAKQIDKITNTARHNLNRLTREFERLEAVESSFTNRLQQRLRNWETATRRYSETFQNFQQSMSMLSMNTLMLGAIPAAITAIGTATAVAYEKTKLSFIQLKNTLGATEEQMEDLKEVSTKLYTNGFVEDKESGNALIKKLVEENRKLLENKEELKRLANMVASNAMAYGVDEQQFQETLSGFQNSLGASSYEQAISAFDEFITNVKGGKESIHGLITELGDQLKEQGYDAKMFVGLAKSLEQNGVKDIKAGMQTLVEFEDKILEFTNMGDQNYNGPLIDTLKKLGKSNDEIQLWMEANIKGNTDKKDRDRRIRQYFAQSVLEMQGNADLMERLQDDIFEGKLTQEAILSHMQKVANDGAVSEYGNGIAFEEGLAEKNQKEIDKATRLTQTLREIKEMWIEDVGKAFSDFFEENEDNIKLFVGWLADMIGKFSDMVGEFSAWSAKPENEGKVEFFAKLYGVIMGIALVLPIISSGFMIVNSIIEMTATMGGLLIRNVLNPIKFFFKGLPGESAGFVKLLDKLARFKGLDNILKLLGRGAKFIPIVGTVITILINAFDSLKTGFKDTFAFAKELFDLFSDLPDNEKEAEEWFGRLGDTIGEWIGKTFGNVLNVVMDVISGVFGDANTIQGFIRKSTEFIAKIIAWIITNPDKVIGGIVKFGGILIGGIFDGISSGFDSKKGSLKIKFEKMVEEIKTFFLSGFEDMWNKIVEIFDAINKLNPLADQDYTINIKQPSINYPNAGYTPAYSNPSFLGNGNGNNGGNIFNNTFTFLKENVGEYNPWSAGNAFARMFKNDRWR